MKVIIAGTRYKDKENKIPFDDYSLVVKGMALSGFTPTEIVSGRAIGVDQLGEQWAVSHDLPIKAMAANWHKFGKGAGAIRNRDMVSYCDCCVVVWNGESPGTKNLIQECIKQKKPYYVVMSL